MAPPDGLVDRAPAADKWSAHASVGHKWRWRLLREHAEPPVSVLNPVEDPDPDPKAARVGICCSGGGIRSASFNLGALQAVQEQRRLQEAKYFAAVSGGAYIAAAFAMVAKTRKDEGPGTAADDSDPALVTPEAPPFHPGSPEEQYLRNRVSYLAPTGSAKAFLVWRLLLGLLVNLLLIGAVLVLVAAVLCLHYRAANPGLIRPPPAGQKPGASPDVWVWGAGLGLAALGLVMGMFAILLRLRAEGVRQFLEAWSLPVFAFGVIVFAAGLTPVLIEVIRHGRGARMHASRVAGGGVSASVAAILGAIVVQLRAQIADPGKAIQAADTRIAALAPRMRLALIYLASWILGPLVVFAMLIAAITVQLESPKLSVQAGVPAGAFIVLLLFSLGDLNSWSLHPFYRMRLCTAFALRRIRTEGDPPAGHAEQRRQAELVRLSETHVEPQPPWPAPDWPTLLVCAAANISDPGATPPGRGVTSFTFSARELGGPLVGGVLTKDFEDALPERRRRDFTLAAAVAMSGAAIAPSMGKASRPSIRFLLAMANVRLGVWLPNPRRMESFVRVQASLRDKGLKKDGKRKSMVSPTAGLTPEQRATVLTNAHPKQLLMPRPTARYLLKELLGWNSINDKFLYVTDGGHYENLGLVELLRRGCTHIYCFDASNGPPLGALGDAIALARTELGVDIAFEPEELAKIAVGPEPGAVAAGRCATGTLCYRRFVPAVTGTIVYCPTVLTADLPWDVHSYKRRDASFPHDSTVNQLFTDQKFEAYRILGYHSGRSAIVAMDTAIDREPYRRVADPPPSPAGT
ncbi:MAG: hypothetical protein QOE44_166 [Solirubrobacteraceae bacterium]|nr:hypothetical protein [Solirubrobacteraceae bacterium]